MEKNVNNESSWKMEGISWVKGMWIIKSIVVKDNKNLKGLPKFKYNLSTSDCMALVSSKIIEDIIEYFKKEEIFSKEIELNIIIVDDISNNTYESVDVMDVCVDRVYNTKKTMAGYLLAKNTIDSIIIKGMDEVAEDMDVDQVMIELFGHTVSDERLEEMGLVNDSEILQE